MTAQIIVAVISLLAAIAGFLKWYYKRGQGDEIKRERAFADAILKQEAKVRLSIDEAEKRAREGSHDTEDILAGRMSRNQLNRVRSGLRPSKNS